MIVPVILCGGSGTRLWPLSRTHEPKQLQTLFGTQSILVHTALRLRSMPVIEAPILVCSERYAREIRAHCGQNEIKPGAMLEEPMGRDTAAAGALAAHWIAENFGPDAIMALLPADHFVADVRAFQRAILEAARCAQQGYIATIGVQPSRPETGYGYIRRAALPLNGLESFAIEQFVEKPDLATAKHYIDTGDHVWNAGIFLAQASVFLSELARYAPDIHQAVAQVYDQAMRSDGELPVLQFSANLFATIPKMSIDYALAEKTRLGAVLPAEFGWSDVGSWQSVRELGQADDQGNVLSGEVCLLDAHGNLVQARDRLVALVGVRDLTIIDTRDALLVCGNDAVQDVKKLHAMLEAQQHPAASRHAEDPTRFARDCEKWAIDWLIGSVLPLWVRQGLDPVNGGAIEAFASDGRPMNEAVRRMRVQARQIYVFGQAHTLGWREGASAMERVLVFWRKHYALENGGWRNLCAADGTAQDERIETYNHAFGLMALAWAYHVTGDRQWRDRAYKSLDLLLGAMRHPLGGFVETLPDRAPHQAPRRADPHMHLFEAAIHWMELHHDERMAALAAEIAQLYRRFLCVDGLAREHFEEDLTPLHRPEHATLTFVAPGHLIEWAHLLRRYARISGRAAGPHATLEAFVERFGLSANTGLLVDHCFVEGEIPAQNGSRLWPQTEYVRLKLEQSTPAERYKGLAMLDRIRRHYLARDGVISGLWRDSVGLDGESRPEPAPASSLYHIMGAWLPLLVDQRGKSILRLN